MYLFCATVYLSTVYLRHYNKTEPYYFFHSRSNPEISGRRLWRQQTNDQCFTSKINKQHFCFCHLLNYCFRNCMYIQYITSHFFRTMSKFRPIVSQKNSPSDSRFLLRKTPNSLASKTFGRNLFHTNIQTHKHTLI